MPNTRDSISTALISRDNGRFDLAGRSQWLSCRKLDGTFSAIQLGEWGYHFHRLQWDRAWWGRVLGRDFDAQVDHFIKPKEPWTLTSHGQAAAEAFQFMRSHDRGTPYTPLAVVLDHYAGYCPYHTDAWGILPRTPGDQEIYDLLEVGVNPETERPEAISNARLREIEKEYLPIAVEGDPIQYQINRNKAGWVIELVNNDGVVKENIKPAVVYPTVIANVKLTPRFEWDSAREWMTATALSVEQLTVEVPPGDTRFVEFKIPH